MFQELFERCLNTEEIIEVWKQSYIFPINKKNTKTDPKNYRKIVVMLTVGRVYSIEYKEIKLKHIQVKLLEE